LKLEDGDDDKPPGADAVSVRLIAAVSIVIEEKVASPEELVLAVAPEAMATEELSVTNRPLFETSLPNWSSTWTVTDGEIAVPVKTLAGGSVVNTRLSVLVA